MMLTIILAAASAVCCVNSDFLPIIVPLPGHTFGSVGVIGNGVLYCGDAFTALWKRPDITPHAVSPKLMRKSLERIAALSPEWLACGHGLPMRFEKALPVIEEYLSKNK